MHGTTTSAVRRIESRLRTDLPAQLITLSGSQGAALCDLSRRGARLHCAQPLSPGAECVLNWLQFESFGTIVWSNGSFAGMVFDEPLAEQTVLRTRAIIDEGQTLNTRQANYAAARDWYMNLRG